MNSRALNHDRQIEFWIAKISDIPTLPAVVHQTIQVVNNPNSSIRQISETLSQDPSLSTRVLRLANSSYYAIPGGATTIERAVTALGIDNVSQMVFTAAVFSQFDLQAKAPFDVRAFWQHSLGVAVASETIAIEVGLRDSAMIFLAGLVHDIGKLVHFQIAKDEWLAICDHAQKQNLTLRESELEPGSVPHDALGYELVRQWNLPPMIQEAVRSHHDACTAASHSYNSGHDQKVGVVHLANLLTHSMKFGHSGHMTTRNPSKEIVKKILGDENALAPVAKSTRKALNRVTPLFQAMFSHPSANA